MLMDDVAVAVKALDGLARQLHGSAYTMRLAVLRAQLLNLAHEIGRRPMEERANLEQDSIGCPASVARRESRRG